METFKKKFVDTNGSLVCWYDRRGSSIINEICEFIAILDTMGCSLNDLADKSAIINRKVKRIEFGDWQLLHEEDYVKLFTVMKEYENVIDEIEVIILRKLHLNNSIFALAQSLRLYKKLRVLDLKCCYLSERGLLGLSSSLALSSSPLLTVLNLSENPLGSYDKFMNSFSVALANCCYSLTDLMMARCDITEKQFKTFVTDIFKPSSVCRLMKFDISNNNIRLSDLAKILIHSSSSSATTTTTGHFRLKHLICQSIIDGWPGVSNQNNLNELIDVLCLPQYCNIIERIDLGTNSGITDSAPLAKLLLYNRLSLHTLILKNTGIGRNNTVEFSKAILSSTSLRVLSLERCVLDEIRHNDLAKAICLSSSLEDLNILWNMTFYNALLYWMLNYRSKYLNQSSLIRLETNDVPNSSLCFLFTDSESNMRTESDLIFARDFMTYRNASLGGIGVTLRRKELRISGDEIIDDRVRFLLVRDENNENYNNKNQFKQLNLYDMKKEEMLCVFENALSFEKASVIHLLRCEIPMNRIFEMKNVNSKLQHIEKIRIINCSLL